MQTEKRDDKLWKAVWNNNLEKVKKHLGKGANINCTDKYGSSLLHIATTSYYPEIVKYLLEEGIDITIKDNRGYTSLKTAELLKFTDIIKIFEEF